MFLDLFQTLWRMFVLSCAVHLEIFLEEGASSFLPQAAISDTLSCSSLTCFVLEIDSAPLTTKKNIKHTLLIAI